MGDAFAWIGRIVERIGEFVPQWRFIDSRESGVKFRTVLLRDLVRFRWDPSVKTSTVTPGVVLWWPIVSEVTWTIVARQSVNLATQTITTTDGKAVAIGGAVIYRIRDAHKLLTDCWNPDTTIRDIAAGAVHDVCSGKTWEELQRAKGSGALMVALRRELRRRLRPFGVSVITTNLTDFAQTRVLKVIQTTSQDAAA
jgi:regulator of protease activity HflC (stomatin/prohibitin superfamily)